MNDVIFQKSNSSNSSVVEEKVPVLDQKSSAQLVSKYGIDMISEAENLAEAAYISWLEAMIAYEERDWQKSLDIFNLCNFWDKNWVYEGMMGITLSLLDKYDLAINYLSSAIKMQKGNPLLYPELQANMDQKQIFYDLVKYLTLSLFVSGQYELANQWLDYFSKEFSPDPMFQIQIAGFLSELGNYNGATSLIRQALPKLETEVSFEQKTHFLNLSKEILESIKNN